MTDPAAALFRGSAALGFDPREAATHLCAADPVMATLVAGVGPLELGLQAFRSPFDALAEAIVYQQLTGKAAATIFGRLRALSGADRFLTPTELLALPDEALRGAGVSRPKAAALRDLARRTAGGEVPSAAELAAMEDDAIVECLTGIRGIGRWTVEMLLIFRLGRPDVLPVDDYGLRKGFMRAYGLPELPRPRDVGAHGERWRPFRSAAAWYLWRASDTERVID